MPTTRLAPSPTGDLHLGNLRTFLLTWLLARGRGWRLVMRIEDLDGPRVKAGAVESTLELLRWLGLDHDGPVLRQSEDLEPYRAAMHRLGELGLVYPCTLSRADLRRILSAPHAGEQEQRYPPSLRPSDPAARGFRDQSINHRFATPPGEVPVDDWIAGPHRFQPAEEVGDFVVWAKQAVPAYQLAVVVDDHRQGVTDVVRGDDLLASAARQALLHQALGQPVPRWWHVPLVMDESGQRMAKRQESTSATSLRNLGVSAERLLGLLGAWLGLLPRPEPTSLPLLLERFTTLAKADTLVGFGLSPARFTQEDHRWLLDR